MEEREVTMASFWDEIAKQYNNAENRYRENLNAGLSMLNNKANMIQQGYANAMNNISQQANLLGQSMNIPAQFAQMLANREENALTRGIQQDQFNKSFGLSEAEFKEKARANKVSEELSRSQLELQRANLELERKYKNKLISDAEYERELASNQAEFEKNNLIADYPQAQSVYDELKTKYPKASKAQLNSFLQTLATQGKFKAEEPKSFLQQLSYDTRNWNPIARSIFWLDRLGTPNKED